MTERRPLDGDLVEQAMWSLLDAHPDAGVAAVDFSGKHVELPASIPLTTHHRLHVRAGIDLVAPAHRVNILEQFRQLKNVGASTLHVQTPDGRPATHHLLDVSARHGVIVLVFVVESETAEAVALPAFVPVPPRFGRVRRDEMGVIREADEATCQLTGFTAEELIGHDPFEFLHPDEIDAAVAYWFEVLAAPLNGARRWRGRHLRKDGSWVWLENTSYNRIGDPDLGDIQTDLVDVSEEMAATEAMVEGRELLFRLTEALPLGVLQINLERNVVYRNERLQTILDVPPAHTVDEQFSSVSDEDRPALDAAIAAVLDTGADADVEVRITTSAHRSDHVCLVVLRSLRSPSMEITGAVICVSDVTDATTVRRQLEDRATFDLLTQCHNRASIMEHLRRHLEEPAPGDADGIAVVFVDLDEFKPINDRLGHAAGDQLLITVAERLRGQVRGNDRVGRLGGDEFLIVCPTVASPDIALRVADRITLCLTKPVMIDGHAVTIQASIGVGWSRNQATDADALVALADQAMYLSKRGGKGEPVLTTADGESLVS